MRTFSFGSLKGSFLNRFRKYQKIILVTHGSSLVFIENGPGKRIGHDDLLSECRSKEKTLILLSSPFAFSYLHATIPLTSKEQLQANEEKLGFSRFPKETQQVHSMQLEGDRWLTIYTHLSKEGKQLLEKFRKHKINVSWSPALVTMVRNALSGNPPLIKEGTSVLLLYGRETLKCTRTQSSFHFQHLFAWDNTRTLQEHQPMMENLWEIKPESSPSTTLDLCAINLETDPQTGFLNNLLFPNAVQPILMNVSQTTRSLPAFATAISPIRLATLSLLLLLFWSGLAYSDLQKLKQTRNRLAQEIKSLEAINGQFKTLAESERSLVKMEELKSTVQQLQLKPAKTLEQIEVLLQGNTWIKSVRMSGRSIQLELLDHHDDNASELIERLSKTLGSTNLVESSTELYDQKPVKKYLLTIKRETNYASTDQLAQK